MLTCIIIYTEREINVYIYIYTTYVYMYTWHSDLYVCTYWRNDGSQVASPWPCATGWLPKGWQAASNARPLWAMVVILWVASRTKSFPGNMIGWNSSSRVRHQRPPVVSFAILWLRKRKIRCWEPYPAQDVALWSKFVYAHKAPPKSFWSRALGNDNCTRTSAAIHDCGKCRWRSKANESFKISVGAAIHRNV